MQKEIPEGFKKIGLELTLNNDQVVKMETKVLYFLIRDFYIFYSKVPKFDGKKWTEFHFYCRPQDEISITYRLGCYAQTIFNFYKQKRFENPIHSVPDDFPNCIQIPAEYSGPFDFLIGEEQVKTGISGGKKEALLTFAKGTPTPKKP